jgi:hypothetical protein
MCLFKDNHEFILGITEIKEIVKKEISSLSSLSLNQFNDSVDYLDEIQQIQDYQSFFKAIEGFLYKKLNENLRHEDLMGMDSIKYNYIFLLFRFEYFKKRNL